MTNPRYAFIEQQLGAVEAALGMPSVRQNMEPSFATGIGAVVGNLAVANARGGIITIPGDTGDTGDTIPVVAMRPGESFQLGPEFARPTEQQRLRYAQMFAEWLPWQVDANMVSQDVSISMQSGMRLMSPHGEAAARTVALAMMMPGSEFADMYRLRHFPKEALPKLVKSMLRPIVILCMGSAEPDVVAHELAHVTQKIERPIRIYGSQQDIDMDALADELPAYGVGAGVRHAMNLSTGSSRDPFRQLEADSVRTRHNRGRPDPYEVSFALLSRYRRHGMGHILHNIINFGVVEASLRAQMEEFETAQ